MFNKPPDMSLRKIERILLLNAQRRPAVLGVGKRWYTADRVHDPESTTPEVSSLRITTVSVARCQLPERRERDLLLDLP